MWKAEYLSAARQPRRLSSSTITPSFAVANRGQSGPLLERHGRDGAVDLVLRPKDDGPGCCARCGDVGALAGLAQDLLARRVRHAHDTFDKEHAERLIVDRPAPEFRPTDAKGRDGRRHADVGARQL